MFVGVVQVRLVQVYRPLLVRRRKTTDGGCPGLARSEDRGEGSLTSFKGVLVVGARIVRNFDARPSLGSVLEEVDVGALVEAVVGWLLRGVAVIIMDVAKSGHG